MREGRAPAAQLPCANGRLTPWHRHPYCPTGERVGVGEVGPAGRWARGKREKKTPAELRNSKTKDSGHQKLTGGKLNH